MRNFNTLTLFAVVAIAVTACSSNEESLYLGSRDDIIINNSGVPTSEAAAKKAAQAKIETVKADSAQAATLEGLDRLEAAVAPVKNIPTAVTTIETKPMGTTEMIDPDATKAVVTTPVQTQAPLPVTSAGDIPPNARPGECYAKVLIPAVTESRSERVKVSEESRVLSRIIPAKYDVQTERVLVSEEKKVLDRIIPAKYDVKTERILVSEARQYWKAGHGPITRKNEVTGEIMCLVEEPAVYKTIEKRVLVTPEQPQYKMVPAQYKTVEKRVLVTPEQPEYKTVPARFETITRKQTVRGESWEWRRILCETNMGTDSIQRIQRALNAKGYRIAVDGRIGNETLSALSSYQRKNGLATRGITYETLEHLGVRLIGA